MLTRYHDTARPASGFTILPAIDLRGGRVVRLVQGDYARETVFADDPVDTARAFVEAGATWLHVVDLDGARTGTPAHVDAIGAIVAAVGESASVEVAGGLRSGEAVASVLASRAARAVVGTAALRDPAFAGRLVGAHGSARVAVAIDVRDGSAVGHGWVADAPGIDAVRAVQALVYAGVTIFEVTAIERDGTLGGPDLDLYERLTVIDDTEIIASAGIASVDDLRAVRSAGCIGAIVGRALYDGSMDLHEAIAAVR